jgi:hypothetical protein
MTDYFAAFGAGLTLGAAILGALHWRLRGAVAAALEGDASTTRSAAEAIDRERARAGAASEHAAERLRVANRRVEALRASLAQSEARRLAAEAEAHRWHAEKCRADQRAEAACSELARVAEAARVSPGHPDAAGKIINAIESMRGHAVGRRAA